MKGAAGLRMRPRLTAEQIEEYARKGFLHPIDAMGPDEAVLYWRQHNRVSEFFSGSPKAVQMSQIHRFHLWAWQLAAHPAVLDTVESELGPDILLWSAWVFPKPAHDAGYVTTHQDGTYWGLGGAPSREPGSR